MNKNHRAHTHTHDRTNLLMEIGIHSIPYYAASLAFESSSKRANLCTKPIFAPLRWCYMISFSKFNPFILILHLLFSIIMDYKLLHVLPSHWTHEDTIYAICVRLTIYNISIYQFCTVYMVSGNLLHDRDEHITHEIFSGMAP